MHRHEEDRNTKASRFSVPIVAVSKANNRNAEAKRREARECFVEKRVENGSFFRFYYEGFFVNTRIINSLI